MLETSTEPHGFPQCLGAIDGTHIENQTAKIKTPRII